MKTLLILAAVLTLMSMQGAYAQVPPGDGDPQDVQDAGPGPGGRETHSLEKWQDNYDYNGTGKIDNTVEKDKPKVTQKKTPTPTATAKLKTQFSKKKPTGVKPNKNQAEPNAGDPTLVRTEKKNSGRGHYDDETFVPARKAVKAKTKDEGTEE